VSQVSNSAAHKTAEALATFWRVEGSLLHFSAVRSVAFFTWNAQTFAERWVRRGGVAFLAVLFPLLYALNRIFATRVLYALLRGVSRDRLDLLGEEYFHYILKPKLKRAGVEKLREQQAAGRSFVLVSHGVAATPPGACLTRSSGRVVVWPGFWGAAPMGPYRCVSCPSTWAWATAVRSYSEPFSALSVPPPRGTAPWCSFSPTGARGSCRYERRWQGNTSC
jgi:hypothetical protein